VKATKVTAGLAESNGSLLPGLWRDSLHVTCGLTACTPGSAPGPTLGNEYGKTLPLPFTSPPSDARHFGTHPLSSGRPTRNNLLHPKHSFLLKSHLIFYSLKTVVKRNCAQGSYTCRYNKMLWRQIVSNNNDIGNYKTQLCVQSSYSKMLW